MAPDYKDMSAAELSAALRELRSSPGATDEAPPLELQLQVHQVELEMQDRELRESQQQLGESRSRYANLYELAPVGYCTLDEHGRILEANVAIASLLGVDRAELHGRSLVSLAMSDNPGPFRTHLKKCIKGRERVTAELTLAPPNRVPVVVHAVSIPLYGRGQEVIGCRTAITDISALKRSESRLRLLADASELLASSFDCADNIAKMIRLMVPSLADLVVADLLEQPGRLRRLEVAAGPKNRGLADSLKRSVLSLDGGPASAAALRTGEPVLFAVCTPEGLRAALAHDEEQNTLLADCGARSLMLVPIAARGQVFGLITLVMAESRRHYTGEDLDVALDLARRAGMAIDSARLYVAAQEAVRAREDALAIVSHDLRNPLNTLMMNSELLLRSAPPEGDRRRSRKQLESMKRGIERMHRMINDLLDLASIETGRLSFERARCETGELLREVSEAFEVVAKQSELVLCVEASRESVAVLCDRQRILQVFSNLIGNAVKFTPKGGSIRVRGERSGGEVRFTVEDTGPGISEEQVRRVFERYWQGPKNTRKGLGLGLYIAKGIVEAHGGRIWVESNVGRGASFCFTVPLAIPAETESRSVSGFAPSGPDSASIVLIVDDDTEARLIMAEILESRGYAVVQSSNGLEALMHLRGAPSLPSLILLDLSMPVMDGWQFAAELKKEDALGSIPVILISGGRRLEDEAARLGAVGCVEKPVRIESLLGSVERHCGPGPRRAGLAGAHDMMACTTKVSTVA
jgi:PAS domain S-box-containing protein